MNWCGNERAACTARPAPSFNDWRVLTKAGKRVYWDRDDRGRSHNEWKRPEKNSCYIPFIMFYVGFRFFFPTSHFFCPINQNKKVSYWTRRTRNPELKILKQILKRTKSCQYYIVNPENISCLLAVAVSVPGSLLHFTDSSYLKASHLRAFMEDKKYIWRRGERKCENWTQIWGETWNTGEYSYGLGNPKITSKGMMNTNTMWCSMRIVIRNYEVTLWVDGMKRGYMLCRHVAEEATEPIRTATYPNGKTESA